MFESRSPAASRHDRLVEDLAGHLVPVRPLPAPWVRGLAWFSVAGGVGLLLLPFANIDDMRVRMVAMDLRLASIGAILTALTAAVAAFQSSVPGRSGYWTALPVAPACLWIGASGLGCVRGWAIPGAEVADAREMAGCLIFLLGFSAPLSLALVLMLRRACPLRPNLTAALCGLAAAAAAAALLVPFHPHDATVTDLAVHLVVVGVIIGINSLAGGRLLASKTS